LKFNNAERMLLVASCVVQIGERRQSRRALCLSIEHLYMNELLLDLWQQYTKTALFVTTASARRYFSPTACWHDAAPGDDPSKI